MNEHGKIKQYAKPACTCSGTFKWLICNSNIFAFIGNKLILSALLYLWYGICDAEWQFVHAVRQLNCCLEHVWHGSDYTTARWRIICRYRSHRSGNWVWNPWVRKRGVSLPASLCKHTLPPIPHWDGRADQVSEAYFFGLPLLQDFNVWGDW